MIWSSGGSYGAAGRQLGSRNSSRVCCVRGAVGPAVSDCRAAETRQGAPGGVPGPPSLGGWVECWLLLCPGSCWLQGVLPPKVRASARFGTGACDGANQLWEESWCPAVCGAACGAEATKVSKLERCFPGFGL